MTIAQFDTIAKSARFHLWVVSAVIFAVASHELCRNFPNVDEVAHLPAGVEHLRFGRFDLYRVNPPLVRSVLASPAVIQGLGFSWELHNDRTGMRPEFVIGKAKLSELGLGYANCFRIPKLIAALLTLAFFLWLFLVFLRPLFGISGASVGLLFALGDPNIISQAVTIGPDIASACTSLLVCLIAWKCCVDYDPKQVWFLGFLLGVAMLTKLTLIILLLIVPAMYYIGLRYLRTDVGRSRISAEMIKIVATAVFVVNAGYLFQGSFTQLGDYQFCSSMLGGEMRTSGGTGNRFSTLLFGCIPVPFPKDYVLGIDYLRMEVERKYWSFLNGDWRFGSWAYYYVFTTLYKTPEPTLAAFVISSVGLAIGCGKGLISREVRLLFLFATVPAIICFVAVSFQGGFNHHHRYVLIIYPSMFVCISFLGSQNFSELLSRIILVNSEHRLREVLFQKPYVVVSMLGVLSALSALRVHPYYTSYFNTLSGGPENGWRLLGFSNIDWGQDILEVDRWLKAHLDRRPLVMEIDYFGMNGDLFDVPTINPPQLPKDASIDQVRRSITETQWWIISVKKLYNLPGYPGLEYLQQIEPVERIAYAYHVYRIDPLPAPEESELHSP